jgi:hypothetical protein
MDSGCKWFFRKTRRQARMKYQNELFLEHRKLT